MIWKRLFRDGDKQIGKSKRPSNIQHQSSHDLDSAMFKLLNELQDLSYANKQPETIFGIYQSFYS